MKFEAYPLTPPLDLFIESIFHFENFVPDHSIERVVPTGHLFIIFELDGFKRSLFDNDSLEQQETFTNAWVSGMHKNYISISAHKNSEMLVIQFKPYGAYLFFEESIESLNDSVVSAEKIFGNEIIEIRNKILNQQTASEKLAIVANWITDKQDSKKIIQSEFIQVFKRLQDEPHKNHKKLIESYSKTQKHFINECKKYTGLTPKYYHRIVRFNSILQLIQHKKMINWSQIAYECNYTDQSHFIKDFKLFSGFNPSEFISKDHHSGETNFFKID